MAISTALVVDDSRLARVTMTRLLEKRTVSVEQASSAREALAYLKGNHPDVILMDVTMPDIDGLEATRMITGNPETAAIPVVMCTAEDSDEAREKALACGATGFLTKPASGESIDRIISELNPQRGAPPKGNDSGATTKIPSPPDQLTPLLSAEELESKAQEIVKAAVKEATAELLPRLAREAAAQTLESERAMLHSGILESVKESFLQEKPAESAVTIEEVTKIARELALSESQKSATAAIDLARKEVQTACEQLAANLRAELTDQLAASTHLEALESRVMTAATAAATEVANAANCGTDAQEIEHKAMAAVDQATRASTQTSQAAMEQVKTLSESLASIHSEMHSLNGKSKSALMNARLSMLLAGFALCAAVVLKFVA